jgi:AraC-like DNA-binding protein
MKIFIKNMICTRCKMVVKYELKQLGLHFTEVEMGYAEIKEILTHEQWVQLNDALKLSGLELIVNKKMMLVEKIKNTIIEIVHYSDEELKINLSDYLQEKLNYDYTYLANLFSSVMGMTIERFFITTKIERVKVLLRHDDLQLTEIAYMMRYSSVAHLSNQFKKITGISPSQFKQNTHKVVKSTFVNFR